MLIRLAGPTESAEVGELRIAAYQAGGFLVPDSGYAPRLRGIGADGTGHVLVAVEPGIGTIGQIVGTIMLIAWPDAGPTVTGPGEAEIRALAVRPDAQGGGVGAALVRAVIGKARQEGISHLLLCTEPAMRTAHRIYQRAGFARLPARDWSPEPGVTLLVYDLNLG